MSVRRIAFVAIALAGLAGPASAAAAYDDPAPYCAAVRTIDKPDARYRGPAVPDWMARALKKAEDSPDDTPLEVFKHAAWRCADGRVLACFYGANLPCGEKADPNRRPGQGVVSYCREHPDDDIVPAYVTGLRTVFEWHCRGGKPEIVRRLERVDKQGYAARYWYVVAP
ncbi:MAG TPA: hypothetical protein VMH36_20855 [Alphaproteobacteria bacterium]|nr:hypothetical protein [Alphaproteobacteria bacterium]